MGWDARAQAGAYTIALTYAGISYDGYGMGWKVRFCEFFAPSLCQICLLRIGQ